MTGRTSYFAGAAAEDTVAETYRRRGYVQKAKRWRGQGGEIDLIFEKLGALVFVEVKKSRSFAAAALRLTDRQMQRIHAAAGGYLATMPMGQNTEARFDAALVDASGQVEIVENAFGF